MGTNSSGAASAARQNTPRACDFPEDSI